MMTLIHLAQLSDRHDARISHFIVEDILFSVTQKSKKGTQLKYHNLRHNIISQPVLSYELHLIPII